ncbi:MAG: putative toxin-antitoxin system toxin component, PIN family [Acidobacteriota bacterium]
MRIFLDTNVIVSAFATRGLCADVLHIVVAEHDLLVGKTVLKELRRVLRQKLRLPTATLNELDAFLHQHSTIVSKQAPLAVSVRDANDEAVLAEAVAGGADILVSGDRDLLEIADAAPIQILAPRGLWERLRSHR